MPGGDEVISRLSALIRSPRAASSVDENCNVVFGDFGTIRFKAQFFGVADDLTPLNLGAADLRASEVSAAMWEAISMAWPTQATGFRLLDVSDLIAGIRPTRS
jgi:hypothetical protein